MFQPQGSQADWQEPIPRKHSSEMLTEGKENLIPIINYNRDRDSLYSYN